MRSFALISPREKLAFVRDLAGVASQLSSDADAPLRLYAHDPAFPLQLLESSPSPSYRGNRN
jgi:hypothetical protein